MVDYLSQGHRMHLTLLHATEASCTKANTYWRRLLLHFRQGQNVISSQGHRELQLWLIAW